MKNIVNGRTKDGELGNEFYIINQRIMDLGSPMITEEGQEIVTLYYSESLDPEGRDRKNIISMMMEDGFFKYLPKSDEAFVEFLNGLTQLYVISFGYFKLFLKLLNPWISLLRTFHQIQIIYVNFLIGKNQM